MIKNNKVRVRIAPSPTGYLHVGTARTALFNYLFARSNNGAFLLRIEDTDLKRSRDEMAESIIEGLQWMNLEWDEDILYQSDYFDEYQEKAIELVKRKLAYWCYCTDEELKERKNKAMSSKKGWIYDRRCYHLSGEERERFEKEDRPKAIRFLVPSGISSYEDLIHGVIKKENSEIEDFVILKSDGTPSYNLAVVVDDHRMGITHVIRGDDHISNTPKQILLYKALGWELPEFGHVPLILGKDRSKLSKRHGAVSLSYYKDEGILPEAFVNYLAFLGWSPKTEEEIFSIPELIKRFSLDGIQIKPAIFDIERLEWLNGAWMAKLGREEVASRLSEYLYRKGISIDDKDYLVKVIEALGKRIKKFKDFLVRGYYFFYDDFSYDEEGAKKHFRKGLEEKMKELIKQLKELANFDENGLENVIRNLAEELNCKASELIHPIRLGISGMTVGPGLFVLMEILGKKRVIKRLESLVRYLEGADFDK